MDHVCASVATIDMENLSVEILTLILRYYYDGAVFRVRSPSSSPGASRDTPTSAAAMFINRTFYKLSLEIAPYSVTFDIRDLGSLSSVFLSRSMIPMLVPSWAKIILGHLETVVQLVNLWFEDAYMFPNLEHLILVNHALTDAVNGAIKHICTYNIIELT